MRMSIDRSIRLYRERIANQAAEKALAATLQRRVAFTPDQIPAGMSAVKPEPVPVYRFAIEGPGLNWQDSTADAGLLGHRERLHSYVGQAQAAEYWASVAADSYHRMGDLANAVTALEKAMPHAKRQEKWALLRYRDAMLAKLMTANRRMLAA